MDKPSADHIWRKQKAGDGKTPDQRAEDRKKIRPVRYNHQCGCRSTDAEVCSSIRYRMPIDAMSATDICGCRCHYEGD